VSGLTVLGPGVRAIVDDVSFEIHRGEIVGIAGVEGNGQGELIEAIMGIRTATAGRVLYEGEDVTRWGTRERREAGIGYIPEDRTRHGLLLEAPLWENRMLGHQTQPPNARGPLVDIRGRIIGINARGMRGADNLGFAIPAAVVKDVVDRILKDGKVQRAWTGLRFQALKDFRKSSYIDANHGVLIASVDEDSPAEKAKLHAGDIAVAVNGEPVRGMYETDLPAVERRFAALPVDAPATLDVQRGAETLQVMLTPSTKGRQEGEDFECKKWDLTVKEITKFSDPFLHFQRPRGVYIQGVKFAGNARTSGLANFDIITQIGDKQVESLKDVRDAYDASLKLEKGKRKLLFRVIRTGYRRLVVLDFEKDMEKIEED